MEKNTFHRFRESTAFQAVANTVDNLYTNIQTDGEPVFDKYVAEDENVESILRTLTFEDLTRRHSHTKGPSTYATYEFERPPHVNVWLSVEFDNEDNTYEGTTIRVTLSYEEEPHGTVGFTVHETGIETVEVHP